MSTDLGFVEGARGEQVQVTRFGAGGGKIGFQLTGPYAEGGGHYVTLSRQGIRELATLVEAEEPPSTPDLERRLDAIEKRLEKLEGR